VQNDLDPEDAFAFGINLQRHLAIVHFEEDEIIRRCLDHDSPSGGIAFAFVGMGPVLVAKDRLDPVQVQGRSRPVNQRLEDLLHAMAGMKQQVPAVLQLIGRILVTKDTSFLLIEVEGET
jgi:hypothetical protein